MKTQLTELIPITEAFNLAEAGLRRRAADSFSTRGSYCSYLQIVVGSFTNRHISDPRVEEFSGRLYRIGLNIALDTDWVGKKIEQQIQGGVLLKQ